MHENWQVFLKSEFAKPYFRELSDFLHHAYQKTTVFPPKAQVFRAFMTDPHKTKVVILGQDPYHTPGVAHGLAFSTPANNAIPPSLVNIYKEIDQDVGRHDNETGDLSNWQKQGVLLLNAVLTVEAHKAGSHRNKGWEIFTEATVKYLNQECPHLVFLLWGRDARNKKSLIDTSKHLILEAPHPSPLSAHRGFFGCRHFSKANDFLMQHGQMPIIW